MARAIELSLWRCTARCGCTDEGPNPLCTQGTALFASVQQGYAQALSVPPSRENEWGRYELSRSLYFLHLGMAAPWGRYPLPAGAVHTIRFYPLGEEEYHLVLTHSEACPRCHVDYLRTMEGDWLVNANDLCLAVRDDLEREERFPEQGMVVELAHAREAGTYRWLLTRENCPELQVGALPNRYFLLPSTAFYQAAVTDFLSVEAIKSGVGKSVHRESAI